MRYERVWCKTAPGIGRRRQRQRSVRKAVVRMAKELSTEMAAALLLLLLLRRSKQQ